MNDERLRIERRLEVLDDSRLDLVLAQKLKRRAALAATWVVIDQVIVHGEIVGH